MKCLWKKSGCILLSALILLIALTGCGKTDASSTNSTASAKEQTNSAQSSNSIAYLPYDDSKPTAYNDAIKAYNLFLGKKTDAKGKETSSTLNINQMSTTNGTSGISEYALFDVNEDGIPELHTRSTFHDVFSYQNGQLWHWYRSFNFLNGSTSVLDNGAIFSTHDSTGTEYHYTTFGSDGTVNTIDFSFVYLNNDDLEYFFQGKQVPKNEYDTLTKEYLNLSKKTTAIEWHNYQ